MKMAVSKMQPVQMLMLIQHGGNSLNLLEAQHIRVRILVIAQSVAMGLAAGMRATNVSRGRTTKKLYEYICYGYEVATS